MSNTQVSSGNSLSHVPVALITGAAVRIGAALAWRLHQSGYRIVLHYNRSIAKAQALATELNTLKSESACILQANLVNTDEVLRLAHQAQDQWGRLDVLINNASAFYPTPLASLQDDDWVNLMHTNAKAPLFLSRELFPALGKSKGCILNIVDSTAMHGLIDFTPYAMAKAALVNMTRSLAKELAPNIRVNGISPGVILWPEYDGGMSEADKVAVLERIALRRMGSTDDITSAALFLIEQATYITGQVIKVDGGTGLM